MPPDPIAVELSRSLRSSSVRQAIAPTVARVERQLSARSDEPQAWASISLGTLGFETPSEVRSCWVFVLRAGATFGAERHPNSHQRTIALAGAALFEVFVDGRWSPSPVSAETEFGSAISIPPSVWHRIQVGPQNFISVSFHTVAADQLIEETPVEDDLSRTKRRLYHA